MSREELALETQLLLQEVSQVTQYHQTEAILDEATATAAPVSQYEEAKQALLEKLKKKKEQKRQQMQQVNQKRYSIAPPGEVNTSVSTDAAGPQSRAGGTKVSPVKQRSMMKLPIAVNTGAASRKKKDLLTKLRTQAIQQGSQEMAKLFGYSSYEEQIKHLNKIEKQKILQNELMEQQSKAQAEKKLTTAEDLTISDDEEEQQEEEAKEANTAQDSTLHAEADAHATTEMESEPKSVANIDGSMSVESIDNSMEVDAGSTELVDVSVASESIETTVERASSPVSMTSAPKPVVKRRNQIDDDDEDDGNEADSEQDDKDADSDENDDMEEDGVNVSASALNKDKAAGYRRLLQAEALQNRQRRRLKQTGDFVEAEAEEDEEEDVLKIGGLGDFGFGVPQAKTQESKEAEEERNALKLREDDLEGIVDELSDDEREQAQDLEEIFRKELEDQDRQQVKEVMRNVKEGFGRNRRAFSAGLHMGSEARGRFNLDELVAADGKMEAARLGLLESDEELSDADDASGRKKKKGGEDGEEGEGNEEDDDEEAEMERMLRERYLNQPKIYMTSSESENEEEEERDALNGNGPGADENEVESDEERERQQMKLFSERARINRRMQRMKDLQRQVALDEDEADSSQKSAAAAVPNLLLEEDEDSQELLAFGN
uniref:DNA replication checkpoint mediator MRC1 domain-containing protein n=1 Tax=Globisporangium ultimum (strain ATCC 200006 / CBS 805.95 / DAOM BR144) TaxID=431595 RepID=K3X0S0_GLOUD